jgi:hypothetical protein
MHRRLLVELQPELLLLPLLSGTNLYALIAYVVC